MAELNFNKLGWGDIELVQLTVVLPLCAKLEKLTCAAPPALAQTCFAAKRPLLYLFITQLDTIVPSVNLHGVGVDHHPVECGVLCGLTEFLCGSTEFL